MNLSNLSDERKKETYRKTLVGAVGTEHQQEAQGADEEGMGRGADLQLAPHGGPDGIGAGHEQPMNDGHDGRPAHDGEDRSPDVAQYAGVRQRGDVVDPIPGRMAVVDLGQVGLTRAIGGTSNGGGGGEDVAAPKEVRGRNVQLRFGDDVGARPTTRGGGCGRPTSTASSCRGRDEGRGRREVAAEGQGRPPLGRHFGTHEVESVRVRLKRPEVQQQRLG